MSDDPQVDPEVGRVVRDFVAAGKPLGMTCISPVIAALVLAKEDGLGKAVKLTLGRREPQSEWPYAASIDKVEELTGAELVEVGVGETVVDETHKIFTTPAFMYNGLFHQVHDGIVGMIEQLVASLEP